MTAVELYIDLIQAALLIAIPVLLVLTVFSWFEARRLWPYRVPLILALSNSFIGASATWLAWTVLYREQIGPIPEEWLVGTATAVLILCIVPWLTTVYLVYLEATRHR